MIDKFLENYVNNLYENSNYLMEKERYGLYSKEDFLKILKPVVEEIKEHKDFTIQELRELLYEKSGLTESIQDFINNKEMSSGLVVTYGTPNFQETISIGNRQETTLNENNEFIDSAFNMTPDTLVDLASVTKIFTSLSIYKLVSLGLINLNDEVCKYAHQFKNLQGVTIFDLLTFNTNIVTEKIDNSKSLEEGLEKLENAKVIPFKENSNHYNDMGAMILKYVIENVSNMEYFDFLKKFILNPLEMNDTHSVIPNYKLDRTISSNGGIRYYKDGNILHEKEALVGLVHDPKARLLGQNGSLCGHAGLFSTASDMSKLAKGLIKNLVINRDLFQEMTKNRVGKSYLDLNNQKKYMQYLASLCYSKNPDLSNSEVYHALSGTTLGSGGFVGTQLTVDPLNELYFFMAGNKTHNRVFLVDPSRNNEIKTLENGKKIIDLPNMGEYVVSKDFAWARDPAIVHPSIKLAIQYKMLEDYFMLYDKDLQLEEKTRML